MNKDEAKFTPRFRSWLRANPQVSGAFELKHTRGKDYLPFREVVEHQLDALLACVGDRGFSYKISDDSIGAKPFDLLYYRNSGAYIVISYPDFFCLITVKKFIKEKENSTRKSLIADRAKVIAEIVV